MHETTANVELELDLWLIAKIRAFARSRNLTFEEAIAFLLEG